MERKKKYTGPPPSRRDHGVPLWVYRSRTTMILLVVLQVFGLVCFQTGRQMYVASILPEGRANLPLAWLWIACTGLLVVYVALLFWEATRLHFLPRALGIGLQFAYGVMCGWIGWLLLPFPLDSPPLPWVVSLPLALVGIWGTLSLGFFALLLAWDSQRGPSSRKLKDWRERTPWNGSFPSSPLTAAAPEHFINSLLDAWYEVREAIKRDAQEE